MTERLNWNWNILSVPPRLWSHLITSFKVPSPNTASLGISVQDMNLWGVGGGKHIYSASNTLPSLLPPWRHLQLSTLIPGNCPGWVLRFVSPQAFSFSLSDSDASIQGPAVDWLTLRSSGLTCFHLDHFQNGAATTDWYACRNVFTGETGYGGRLMLPQRCPHLGPWNSWLCYLTWKKRICGCD